MIRAVPVNPSRAIVPPGGPSRGRKAYRYLLVEHAFCPSVWSIRREHGDTRQQWQGRERGWAPVGMRDPPKLYTQRGHAVRTLRKLQAIDAEVVTAAGRRRRLERLAPELLDALRDAVGALEDASYACDPRKATRKGRDVLARADRILNFE